MIQNSVLYQLDS